MINGIAFSSPSNYSVGIPNANAQTLNSIDQIWLSIFSGSNGQYFLNRFANQASNWWEQTLFNNLLSPLQKFQQIFGISAAQSNNNAQQLLGDLMSWLNSLFSRNNLYYADMFLREGQNVANNILSPQQVATPQTTAVTVSPAPVTNTLMDIWNNNGSMVVLLGLIFLGIYFIKK